MKKYYWVMTLTGVITVFSMITSDAFGQKGSSIEGVDRLADGVYAIRHKNAPDAFPQGNTTVIVGSRDVLVVDSCYLLSTAKEDINLIKEWTKRPVRYLVNTHWHYDHTMGNGTYWSEFPQISIIAHTETAKNSVGYNPGWFERFPRRADVFRQVLETGKDNYGKTLSEDEKEISRKAMDGLRDVHAEFKSIVDPGADGDLF